MLAMFFLIFEVQIPSAQVTHWEKAHIHNSQLSAGRLHSTPGPLFLSHPKPPAQPSCPLPICSPASSHSPGGTDAVPTTPSAFNSSRNSLHGSSSQPSCHPQSLPVHIPSRSQVILMFRSCWGSE